MFFGMLFSESESTGRHRVFRARDVSLVFRPTQHDGELGRSDTSLSDDYSAWWYRVPEVMGGMQCEGDSTAEDRGVIRLHKGAHQSVVSHCLK